MVNIPSEEEAVQIRQTILAQSVDHAQTNHLSPEQQDAIHGITHNILARVGGAEHIVERDSDYMQTQLALSDHSEQRYVALRTIGGVTVSFLRHTSKEEFAPKLENAREKQKFYSRNVPMSSRQRHIACIFEEFNT